MRILHRYILKEMLKALALGLAAISGVVCFALVLVALQQKGLGPTASLMYMGLSIPGALYIALPLAAVLAASLIYGRLAADNEVMACRASGIPPSSLFWPTILLAIVAAGLVLALAAWPLPESRYAAKRLARADLEHLFFSQLANGKVSVKEANFKMTVDFLDGNKLYGPMITYRDSRRGQTYCYAPFGRVLFHKEQNQAELDLWQALVLRDEAHSERTRGAHIITLDLPTSIPRVESELSLWNLVFIQRHPEYSDRIRKPNEGSAELQEVIRNSVRSAATAEFHGRLATALGCFGLVLVGAGLGMYFHSGHLLIAFGVALVPWMGTFLVTTAGVKTASRAADPQSLVWVIWAPNALVVLLGLGILAHLVWFWGHPVRLRDRLRGRRSTAGPRLGRSAG